MRTLMALLLLASLSFGCKDSRLPEERSADALEARLDHNLKLEVRRQEARNRMANLQREYDRKIANLRGATPP